jgi:hypothetical protein
MKQYIVIDAFATASSVKVGEIAQLSVYSGKPCNTYKTALLDMLNSAIQRMGSHKWDEPGLSFIVHYATLEKSTKKANNYEELTEMVFDAKEGTYKDSSKEITAMQLNTNGSEYIWRIAAV